MPILVVYLLPMLSDARAGGVSHYYFKIMPHYTKESQAVLMHALYSSECHWLKRVALLSDNRRLKFILYAYAGRDGGSLMPWNDYDGLLARADASSTVDKSKLSQYVQNYLREAGGEELLEISRYSQLNLHAIAPALSLLSHSEVKELLREEYAQYKADAIILEQDVQHFLRDELRYVIVMLKMAASTPHYHEAVQGLHNLRRSGQHEKIEKIISESYEVHFSSMKEPRLRSVVDGLSEELKVASAYLGSPLHNLHNVARALEKANPSRGKKYFVKETAKLLSEMSMHNLNLRAAVDSRGLHKQAISELRFLQDFMEATSDLNAKATAYLVKQLKKSANQR